MVDLTENIKVSTNSPNPEDGLEQVLFVDDEPRILSSIRRLIRPMGIRAFFAENGKDGLSILEQNNIDLVVSDMRMPEMDGAEFLTIVKTKWPDTVRVLLTGFADMASTIEALNKGGIYRYISKPWDDDELKMVINDALKIRRLEKERDELISLTQSQNAKLQDLNTNLEKKVQSRTEEIRQTSDMLDLAYKELTESYDTFIRVFSSFLESREALKKGQSQLVADFSKKIATALKLKESSVQAIYYAGLLHQIGKMGLPDSLLEKPEALMTTKEKQQYWQYPVIGEAALTAINGLEKTARLIRAHAELYDGSGFPDNIKGKEIKPGARIITAVRDYIGLQTGLINASTFTSEQAIDYIKSQSGKKYDSAVVRCLVHFRKEFDVSVIYSDEMQIESHALQPGMRLTRDLTNTNKILLISKGHILNKRVIERILSLEKVENAKLILFVAKEVDPVPEYNNPE